MMKKPNYKSRKLARSVAKAKMERAGAKHVNSIFAYYWRDYVFEK